MAHSKHRKKTLRKATEQRLVNRGKRSNMRTAVKAAREVIAVDPKNAADELSAAVSKLDRAGRDRLIHPKRASRLKSRLAKAHNRAIADQS